MPTYNSYSIRHCTEFTSLGKKCLKWDSHQKSVHIVHKTVHMLAVIILISVKDMHNYPESYVKVCPPQL